MFYTLHSLHLVYDCVAKHTNVVESFYFPLIGPTQRLKQNVLQLLQSQTSHPCLTSLRQL